MDPLWWASALAAVALWWLLRRPVVLTIDAGLDGWQVHAAARIDAAGIWRRCWQYEASLDRVLREEVLRPKPRRKGDGATPGHAPSILPRAGAAPVPVGLPPNGRLVRWRWETEIGLDDAADTAWIAGGVWTLQGTVSALLQAYAPFESPPDLRVVPCWNERRLASRLHCIARWRLSDIIRGLVSQFFHRVAGRLWPSRRQQAGADA